MEELSIKEKAERYDEALDRAKKELDTCGSQDCDAARQVFRLFPELKESEDERIRKEIIATIHLYYGEPLEDEAQEMIAWLEKQCEQKSSWSEEDEKIIETMCKEGDLKLSEVQWLKSLKERVLPQPKQEWSEEDKNMARYIGNAITTDEASNYLKEKDIEVIDAHVWLDSFKDRVQPQPKQEWSEEDNIILSRIIADYERSNEEWFNAQNSLPHGRKIAWLKSLRPQNTWKPSDAQMASITCAVRKMKESACYDSELVSLLNDLKKLREEDV